MESHYLVTNRFQENDTVHISSQSKASGQCQKTRHFSKDIPFPLNEIDHAAHCEGDGDHDDGGDDNDPNKVVSGTQ